MELDAGNVWRSRELIEMKGLDKNLDQLVNG
jgi:hypothetical protein